MLTLHYYLLEYNSGNYVPAILNQKFSENIDLFNFFNQKWFYPDAPFFRELDLNWEGIEDQIISTLKDDNEVRTEVVFENGSVIKFFDDNDNIQSFYILEEHLSELTNELKNIMEKLK